MSKMPGRNAERTDKPKITESKLGRDEALGVVAKLPTVNADQKLPEGSQSDSNPLQKRTRLQDRGATKSPFLESDDSDFDSDDSGFDSDDPFSVFNLRVGPRLSRPSTAPAKFSHSLFAVPLIFAGPGSKKRKAAALAKTSDPVLPAHAEPLASDEELDYSHCFGASV